MATPRALGAEIKALRDARGLSQEDLARKVGVGTGTISTWERDDSQPRRKNLAKLAEALDVPVGRFGPASPAPSDQLGRIEADVRHIRARLDEIVEALASDDFRSAAEALLAADREPAEARE